MEELGWTLATIFGFGLLLVAAEAKALRRQLQAAEFAERCLREALAEARLKGARERQMVASEPCRCGEG